MNSYSIDLQAALNAAEMIARQAGTILLQYYERGRESVTKSSQIDLVTEADQASEAFIVKALRERFPDHRINGEEGGGYGPALAEAPYQWWVDPLDGTTNFAHRFPVFAVSLAMSTPDARPVLGVVYDPTRDECFKAIRGQGATLNGRPLRVSDVGVLSQALAATGFPYDAWTAQENNADRIRHFLLRTQGLRRAGSAALDVCYVAAGRCDLYWERGPQPWDVQAGIVIVEEAGGKVTDFEGQWSEDAYLGHRIVVTNGLLHEQTLEVIRLGDAAPRPDVVQPAN